MEENKESITEMLGELDETDGTFIKTIQAMIRHYLEKKRRR